MEGERCYRDLSWIMMGESVSRERELEVDLESGGTTSEEDRSHDLGLENELNNRFSDRAWNGHLDCDGLLKSSRYSELAGENVELFIEKYAKGEEGQHQMVYGDSRHMEEKHKKKNSRKAPKPPRPPKGPPLDAADHKLMKEIAELAMRKRARVERIKALKKMRAAKASSWSSSLTAMVITVLFLLIILFQGMCSTSSGSILLRGSPEPALAAGEDLVSVQFYKNFTAYESNEPGSNSFDLAEGQVSGSGFKRK